MAPVGHMFDGTVCEGLGIVALMKKVCIGGGILSFKNPRDFHVASSPPRAVDQM